MAFAIKLADGVCIEVLGAEVQRVYYEGERPKYSPLTEREAFKMMRAGLNRERK